MHTRHIIKAYYIETKCSTDTHHADWLGGQTIQAVHFTFLSCLSCAGASGRKFDRQVEGGKSPVDCFQEISSSKQWKGKSSSQPLRI